MKLFVTNITYSTAAGLTVYLSGRLENGERAEIPFHGTEPHFYVSEPIQDHELIVRTEEDAGVTMYGEPVTKIVTKYPPDVPVVRGDYMYPYESDVAYPQRVRYEYGIKNCIELPNEIPERLTPGMIHPIEGKIAPRVFTLDIETYYQKKGGTAAYPTNPVNCVTFKDSYSGNYLTIFVGKLTDEQVEELQYRLAQPDPDVGRKVPLTVKLFQVADEYKLFSVMKGVFEQLKPDVVRGWNLSEFDWPYLKNRAAQRQYISPRWERIEAFDSMLAYKKLHERSIGKPKDGVSLDAVARNEGYGNKVAYDGDLVDLYENDPVTFIYYNVMDVYLTDAIDDGCFGGCTENYLRIARMAGCSLSDTQSEMAVVDSYTFHKFRGRFVQPATSRAEGRPVEGGHVFLPIKGVYRYTHQVDNSQEYTAMIRTMNISPETKIPEGAIYDGPVITSPNGTRYKKAPRGAFPEMLDGMSQDQDNFQALFDKTGDVAWKQLRQANKNINHSFFGNFLNPHWRNFDPDIGADILAWAREHLKHNAAIIEDMGGKVIYGDTDSCYFILPNVEGREAKLAKVHEITKVLNESYPAWCAQWGATESFLSVKVEGKGIYHGQLFAEKASGDDAAKKRYVVVEEGEVKGSNEIFEWNGETYSMTIKGFHSIRSDSTSLTRRIQPELFKVLLMEEDYGVKAVRLIKNTIDDIQSGRTPLVELGIPMSLGKAPEEYTTNTLQSRSALFSNRHLGKSFGANDSIRIYYGYIEGYPRTDVFAIGWNDEIPPGARIDLDKHIERALEKPLTTVLDAAGLQWKDVRAGVKAQTLDDFF